jgi:YVTN family beta-propeller protein
VYCESTGKIYVVDGDHNSVSVIDSSGHVKSVNVGSGPQALAVNDKTGRVYVVNSRERSVSVIDGSQDRVIATVTMTTKPYAIAVDEVADKIYVSNGIMIDGNSNLATNLRETSADAIVVDSGRRRIFELGYETDSVTMLDAETHVQTKIQTGGLHLWGMGQLGRKLYVTHIQDGTVTAIDIDAERVTEITTGPMPCALAVNAEANEIYVANYEDGSVALVDANTDGVRGTVRVGGRLQAIAVDSGPGIIYVADAQGRTVSAIDIHTQRVMKKVIVANPPYALAVNARTHAVYAATMGDKGYVRIDIPPITH